MRCKIKVNEVEFTVSGQAAIVSSLPGRYATALFELAKEATVDDAKAMDAIAADMDRLRAMIDESADLRDMLKNPLVARGDQAKALLALADAAKFHANVKNLLGVLAQERRLGQLNAIIDAFNKMIAAHRGEVSAEVISAAPLGAAQLKDLKAQLKEALNADVTVNAHVDEGLLGGLIVKVGSKQIDSSVKTKLNRLTVAMKGAG